MYIFLLKESPMDLISSSIISKFKFFFYQGHFIGKAVTNLLDIHKKREYDCSEVRLGKKTQEKDKLTFKEKCRE